jgi:fibronectin-binding autotransporter adhesin
MKTQFVIAAIAASVSATLAQAAIVYNATTGTAGTPWDTYAWSPVGVPGATDVANFNSSSSVTLNLNGSRVVDAIGQVSTGAVNINVTTSGDTITLEGSGTGITAGLTQAQILKTSAGSLTINSGLVLGSNNTWAIQNTTGSVTVRGVTTESGGARSLTRGGNGTLVFGAGVVGQGATVSHSGGTTLNAGTTQFFADAGGAGPTNNSFGSGAITLNNNAVFEYRPNGNTNGAIGNLVNNISVSSTGGTLRLGRGVGNPSVRSTGVVTLDGDLVVDATSGGGTSVVFNGLQGNVKLNSLPGDGSIRITRGNNSSGNTGYAIAGNISDGTTPGVPLQLRNILNSTSVTQAQLRILGSNTYTGGTTIVDDGLALDANFVAGSIEVGASGSLGTGDVTVQAGALLRMLGDGISDSALLDVLGGTPHNGTVFVAANVNVVVGALTLGGVSKPVGVYTNLTDPSFIVGAGSIQVVGIPEPTTLAAAGAVAIVALRRRKA